jgi:trehalose-6-phosphatase
LRFQAGLQKIYGATKDGIQLASDKTSKERSCPVQEGRQAVECQQQPQEPKGASSPKAGSDHSEPKDTIAGVFSGNQPHFELRRVVCQGNQEQNTDDKGKAEPFQAISKVFAGTLSCQALPNK